MSSWQRVTGNDRETEEDGVELDAWLPHGLRLKQQPLAVGLDTVLQLVVPSDVDAVCDIYISRGALELCV